MPFSQHTKRNYHPLVLYFYFNNQLSKEQLKQIPKTTLYYWQNVKTDELFGNDWFVAFHKEQSDFLKIQQHRYLFKCLRIVLKVLYCFSSIQQHCSDFKKAIKVNHTKIVSVVEYLKLTIGLNKACRLFSISTQQFYHWKNKKYCNLSPFHFCFKKHPSQLTVKEFQVIKKAFENLPYPFLPKVSMYYDLMNLHFIHCSLSTFYKYAAVVTGSKIKTGKPYSAKPPLQSSRPFEYLHIDTTFINTLKEGVQRVVFIKDHFSKAILHYAIVPGGKSEYVASVLKQTFQKYHLSDVTNAIHIVSDKGNENKGEVLNWIDEISKTNPVYKITAGEHNFMFTNNEVESAFSIFKNQFAKNKVFNEKHDLHIALEEFYNYNNNIRYPKSLYGLHPNQVLSGEKIDKYRFAPLLKIARNQRYLTNKSMNDCKKCG